MSSDLLLSLEGHKLYSRGSTSLTSSNLCPPTGTATQPVTLGVGASTRELGLGQYSHSGCNSCHGCHWHQCHWKGLGGRAQLASREAAGLCFPLGGAAVTVAHRGKQTWLCLKANSSGTRRHVPIRHVSTPQGCLGLDTSCPIATNVSDRSVGMASRVHDKGHDGKVPTFRGHPA